MEVDYRPVEIRVTKGARVNNFISQLHQKRVKIKHIKHSEKEIQFEIARKDVKMVRSIRKKYGVKVKINYIQQSQIFQKNGWTLIGIFLLIIMPIVFSQFIWDVKVEAETPEMRSAVEKIIHEKLTLREPTLKRKLQTDFEIRQTIMEQQRDLSWVHIIKKGSSITIIPQLAPLTDDKKMISDTKNHLIAAKSGVVTHFNITSGERRVLPNTSVYDGDLLVSGMIMVGERFIPIGASGEVYADYWLETEFTIPREVHYISASSKEWEFDFKNKHEKGQEQSFQKVDLPKWLSNYVEIKRTQKYTTVTEKISEKQIESFIMPLLHEKVLKSLPPKTIIKKENLLHVTFDDDTVKGKVLFLVNENIAKSYPISQGD